MSTEIKLNSTIKQLEAAMKNKAVSKENIAKFKTQLDKAKSELAELQSPKSKKSVAKPKALTALQKLKGSTKSAKLWVKSYEDDKAKKALHQGKRISQGLSANQHGTAAENKGRVYHENRLNHADVDRRVRLEDGGIMAKGGKKDDKISKVVTAIRKTKIHPDDVSPNFVNEIANEIGVNLSSKEVVDISDNYGTKYEDGGMMAKGGNVTNNFDWSKMSYNERLLLARESGLENPSKIAITEIGLLKPYEISAIKNSIRLRNEVYGHNTTMAKGGKIGAFEVGQSVIIVSDNDNYDKYIGKELVVTHKSTSGRFFDSSMEGQGLYDLKVKKTGEEVPFALYDYEIEEFEDGGMMAKGGEVKENRSRDMMFRSQQKWEQEYVRKRKPKNRRYKTSFKGLFEEGGMMAYGGEIIRNKNKNSFNDIFNFYLENNETPVSKGDLMNMAYGQNYVGVDSAIPQSMVGDVDNTKFYVFDYQTNKIFGELVDLRLKLKFSNYPVSVTIVKDGKLMYGDDLPYELINATFHQAIMYVFSNDDVSYFDIRPKKEMAEGGTMEGDEYAKGGKLWVKSYEDDKAKKALHQGKRISQGLTANQYGTAAENKGRVYHENRLDHADVDRRVRLEDGGMMAKGGITEHGLMLGDTIYYHNGEEILVKDKDGKYFVVNLNEGTRESTIFNEYDHMAKGGKLWVNSYEDDKAKKALHQGKRISQGLSANQHGTAAENKGRVYHENRLDHADFDRRIRLEDGGEIHKLEDYI
ncbi:MAG: hypothetical protein ACOVNU_09285 [Candidatus Kapaibacteriota bacterium]